MTSFRKNLLQHAINFAAYKTLMSKKSHVYTVAPVATSTICTLLELY